MWVGSGGRGYVYLWRLYLGRANYIYTYKDPYTPPTPLPPPPPPDVPALPEAGEGGKVLSVRERLSEHRKNPACASCHKVIDPIGFALENYDPTGSWRCTDDGVKIDASTTESLPSGPLAQFPPAHGTGPATKPLSYRQLKPIHGPRFKN